MKYTLTIFTITLASFSCSEIYCDDAPMVPYSGEYEPVSFIIESEGTETLVQDCNPDLGDFTAELKEFVLGNFTIGDTLDSNCQQCGSFGGPYRWASRCDASYSNKGTWTSNEYGATLSFVSASAPDSTLAFTAVNSPRDHVWKLRYKKGEAIIELRYDLKRN